MLNIDIWAKMINLPRILSNNRILGLEGDLMINKLITISNLKPNILQAGSTCACRDEHEDLLVSKLTQVDLHVHHDMHMLLKPLAPIIGVILILMMWLLILELMLRSQINNPYHQHQNPTCKAESTYHHHHESLRCKHLGPHGGDRWLLMIEHIDIITNNILMIGLKYGAVASFCEQKGLQQHILPLHTHVQIVMWG